MVASTITDAINADAADSSSSPALGCSSSVPCSICFDLVIDDGERSVAKLQCGHRFHLDCIGSAFNTKGTMQCPNCRKVESGRWLFADGSAHTISESDTQDWMHNEGPHDFSYSRRPFGFHWCPFSGFTVHSSIEEAESSLNNFTNFQGNHTMITEHTAPPSSTRSYISYFQPREHVGNSNFHHPLNSISASRNNLRATNVQHPSWGWNCHFVPYNVDRDYIDHGNLAPVNPVTLRFNRAHADVARSPSFILPVHYSRQPVPRTGESSVANSRHHQEQPSEITNIPSSTNGYRRYNGARGLPMVLPAVPNRPNHHGFYIRETEHSYNHRASRSSESSNRAHGS